MKLNKILLIFSVLITNSICTKSRQFPKDFLFGVSTAAYQTEGAWNEDGKGESIWDYATHNNPHKVADLSNGDITSSSYHNSQRDVEMLRELGVDVYHFSLSWPRILPTGFANDINEAGIDHYNRLINELVKYNITPVVTLYHWDLPQKLQDLGGFANSLLGEWFEDYARVAFQRFGDRVKFWITFNEPKEICRDGYGAASKAPFLNATGIGDYLCAKNLVLAHARAYRLYKNQFKPTQEGKCGITLTITSIVPLTESVENKIALELSSQYDWGIYAHPIFSEEGGLPKEFSERVALRSARQGYPRSRLPQYSDEEIDFVRGTSDFFGINHYSGMFLSADFKNTIPSFGADLSIDFHTPDDWPKAASTWLVQMPNSLYITLTRVHEKYNNVTIYVTENGWSTTKGLEDDSRVRYFRAAWENALEAIEHGVNLKGYMAWSLMDSFEWTQGYKERFGLFEVDFEDPERKRTPRKSAFVYKHLIKTRYVDYNYEPDSYVMTIDEGN